MSSDSYKERREVPIQTEARLRAEPIHIPCELANPGQDGTQAPALVYGKPAP